MRKRFVAIALLVAVLLSMIACGSSRTQVTSESVEKKDDSIRIWAWDDTFNAKAAKLAAEHYRKKHPQAPRIEVTTKEREEILSDVKLLLSSQVYDQLPDVIMMCCKIMKRNLLRWMTVWIMTSMWIINANWWNTMESPMESRLTAG